MNEDQISTTEELDAALAGKAMAKHDKLWKQAEGRLRWRDFLWFAIVGALLLRGFLGTFEERSDQLGMIGFALAMFLLYMLGKALLQIQALRELVRRLEEQTK